MWLYQLDSQLHHTNSWPSDTSDHFFGVSSLSSSSLQLKRRLFLHSIALETLWLSFTGWWFENKTPSRNSLINLFKKRLARFLTIFEEQAKAGDSLEIFQEFWQPVLFLVNRN